MYAHIITTRNVKLMNKDLSENDSVMNLLKFVNEERGVQVPEDHLIHVFNAKDINSWTSPEDSYYLDNVLQICTFGRSRKKYAIILAEDPAEINALPEKIRQNCIVVK